MEPIISPWWFYLVGIVGYVGMALKIGALALGSLAVIVILDCDEESTKKLLYLDWCYCHCDVAFVCFYTG